MSATEETRTGEKVLLHACGRCGYIEGEDAAPCCRRCGDTGEPLRLEATIEGEQWLGYLTMGPLRRRAASLGIPKARAMRKADLIDAIRGATRSGSTPGEATDGD